MCKRLLSVRIEREVFNKLKEQAIQEKKSITEIVNKKLDCYEDLKK